MKQIQLIKLFISCPGDIKDEKDSIRLIVEEVNKTTGKQNSYIVECLNWTIDTYTQIGEDPQDVINRQLETEYDILVALLWQRLGTPTKRDKSGTVEEINRAIAAKTKEVLVYFKTTPPENLNLIDTEQLNKVNLFKGELTEKGLLYKEFNTIENFESLFRINIINLINDRLLAKNIDTISISEVSNNDRYAYISGIIDEVEQNVQDREYDLDVFALVEQLMSSQGILISSLDSISNSIADLTLKMNNRTRELNTFNNIRDVRLRMQKTQIIVNLFAAELSEFNGRISQETPGFSDNFLSLVPIYSKILLFASNSESEEDAVLKDSLVNLRKNVHEATTKCAEFLEQIVKWPSMTPRFNKSKRQTEEVLKNLTKHMLEGLKLLDEVL